MIYCKKCLIPHTRPNGKFTDGICTACIYHNSISNIYIDWDERLKLLKELIKKDKYKTKKGHFDCIIGVSGGKDSTRQALWVRDKLKLNPLLVCLTYPPEQITERGVTNLSNLINLGFDVIVTSLAPQVWKKTLREGFFNFTNWAKASEQAIISSVPKMAIKYGIPLIFWGENPGLQLGDMNTVGENGYDGNNLRYMNTVSGGSLDWFTKVGFKEKLMHPYKYPDIEEFKKANIQIIYLGWFWNDWSLIDNGMYSAAYGLNVRIDNVTKTGDITKVASLDEDWVTLNQMIKYYKFGFGRVTDFVNEEIRLNRINRETAIELVENYDGNCDEKYIESFCEYIDITVKDFWKHVHKSVNKNLFKVDKNNEIIRKFKVGMGL